MYAEVLRSLSKYKLVEVGHLGGHLESHLVGVYKILTKWELDEQVCLGGLCHSIYGTDVFQKNSVPLSDRDFIKSIIGERAENLAYLFCAIQRDSLWPNLGRTEGFEVFNRFDKRKESISRPVFCNLLEVALANNLELQPRERLENRFPYKKHYLQAEPYLKPQTYHDFKLAYNIDTQSLLASKDGNFPT